MKQVDKLYKKCDKFVKIADVEFPKVVTVSTKALSEGKRVNNI